MLWCSPTSPPRPRCRIVTSHSTTCRSLNGPSATVSHILPGWPRSSISRGWPRGCTLLLKTSALCHFIHQQSFNMSSQADTSNLTPIKIPGKRHRKSAEGDEPNVGPILTVFASSMHTNRPSRKDASLDVLERRRRGSKEWSHEDQLRNLGG